MTRLTNFVILSYSLLDDDDNLFTARGKKPCFRWLLPCKQHLFTGFFVCVCHIHSTLLFCYVIISYDKNYYNNTLYSII